MATIADEFDPPGDVLFALVKDILVPALQTISAETAIEYVARIAVWIRDEEQRKFSVSAKGIGEYEVDENVLVRIRFRRTYHDDRLLFSMESQHEAWRATGFSGVCCRGDILIDDNSVKARLKSKTVCHNSGWRGW